MIKYARKKAATEKKATDRPSDAKGYRQEEEPLEDTAPTVSELYRMERMRD